MKEERTAFGNSDTIYSKNTFQRSVALFLTVAAALLNQRSLLESITPTDLFLKKVSGVVQFLVNNSVLKQVAYDSVKSAPAYIIFKKVEEDENLNALLVVQ